jgi:hypothetical protein
MGDYQLITTSWGGGKVVACKPPPAHGRIVHQPKGGEGGV